MQFTDTLQATYKIHLRQRRWINTLRLGKIKGGYKY